jgi:FkbM family methyltransferase
MLCSNPVPLGKRVFRRLRLHLPHSSRQVLRLGQVRLELDVRDLTMRAMYQDLYEVDNISFLRKVLRPGGTVFDVGANIGYLTAIAASLVGRTGYVHAFEPVPELYRRLERLKALNPQFNIRLSKQAAGAKSDWLDLSLSRDGNLGWNTLVPGFMTEEQSSGQLRVEVVPLDQYLAEQGIERLDFVKIDVEGYEFPVLQGLRYALKHLRPVVLCEIAPGAYPVVGHTIEEFEAFLDQFEYRTFDVRMNPVRIGRLNRTSNVVLLPRHYLHF